jgi:pyruvate dehydrogenase (quinone)
MAQAMGVKAFRVESPGALRSAVAEALAHPGPALVEVMSARQELIMPPRATFEEAKNFGLFMMKAVLDGRASELIDLARVNLKR